MRPAGLLKSVWRVGCVMLGEIHATPAQLLAHDHYAKGQGVSQSRFSV